MYEIYINRPESDTKISPALAALDTDLMTLLVSNFGVIIGVLACLGGRCLGVTRDDAPFVPVFFLVGLFLFTAGVLFSFSFRLCFMADLMFETVESTDSSTESSSTLATASLNGKPPVMLC